MSEWEVVIEASDDWQLAWRSPPDVREIKGGRGDRRPRLDTRSTVNTESHMTRIQRLIVGIGLLLPAVAFAVSGCGADNAASDPARDTTAGAHDDHVEKVGSEGMHGKEKDGEEGEERAEGIHMSPAAIREAGVTVQPVTKDRLSTTLTLPGRVTPTQHGLAHVGTIVPGRVRRLLASEGSRVRRGQALAEIEVYDIGIVKGELMEARADVEQRRAALDRQERLGKEGIGAQRAIEEARGAYRQAMAKQESAEARLRAAGIDPSTVRGGNFSSRVLLRAPISGIVSRRHVALGEYLEPSKDAFEIMNTSVAWIDAQAQPAQAAGIAVGDPGFVSFSDKRTAGRVIFVSPTVDPESRTVAVRVEVDNSNLGLRSDMFVSMDVEQSAPGWGLVVPEGAIESENGMSYVYVEHAQNAFMRVPVEVGRRMGDRVVITGGLQENTRIVVKGIFYVRSARLKGALEEHHH